MFAELAENKGGALDEMTNLEPIDPLDGVEQFLTDAQAKQLRALVKAEEDAQLKAIFESLAYEELGEVQKLLDLTEEQKDAALAVFQDEWAALPEDEEAAAKSPKLTLREETERRLEKFADFLSEEQLEVYRKHLLDGLE